MLTNAAVKAARSRSRAYKIFDERGLYLFVAPTGLRAWRLKYRYEGREKLLSIGRWPEMQLADARTQTDAARALLSQGIDPAVTANTPAHICTFEAVAREWHGMQVEHWTDRHGADVLDSLVRDVFPEMGSLPIGAIASPCVLQLLRDVEARGSIETARRIRQRISAVFAYAIARGLVDHDPAAIVTKALRRAKAAKHQPALLGIEDVRALLDAAERAGGPPLIRIASRFLALTAVRMSALRGARWDEFEDIDGPAPLWRIPAERMKLAKAKKADAANDHLIPLSTQAVQLLRQSLHHNVGGTEMVFPVAVAAIGALYVRAGYRGRHVPHGWRASFSTILNDHFPEERAAIDRALAHSPKDKVEAAYNRSEQIDRRRRLYQAWADMLIT